MAKVLTPLLSLLFTLFIGVSSFGQERLEIKGEKEKYEGVIFFEGSLDEALELAQKSKKGPKLLFVDCYTTWCGPCAVMANTVFPLKRVGQFLNRNFINLKIDMEKGEGIEIARQYKIRAFPTFLILDEDGKEVNRIIGGGNPDKFIEKVKEAMLPANSVGVLRENYIQNPILDNALLYLKGLNSSRFLEEMDHFLVDLSKITANKKFYSEELWPYIRSVIANPQSQLFDLFIEHKGISDTYLGKERVDKEMASALKNLARSFVHKKLEVPDSLTQDQFHSMIVSKVKLLPLISWNDLSTLYFVKIAELYAKGRVDQIASLLDAEKFMELDKSNRTVLEWVISKIDGVPKEALHNYYLEKERLLKKEVKINSHFII
ncbi:MAG: thioredoxin family protein [Bacteroidales bacterium]